jgi:hypothetical protein
MITCKPDKEAWTTVEIDPALEDHCRFSYCGFLDGCYVFPPDEIHHGELGWLCCTGDTPDEVLKKAKELADLLPDGLNSDVESLAPVIKEVQTMKEQDIPFTDHPMPEPAAVL